MATAMRDMAVVRVGVTRAGTERAGHGADRAAGFANSKNARCLTRPDNQHAKAGNINHALGVLRREPDPPEFVALFDADFDLRDECRKLSPSRRPLERKRGPGRPPVSATIKPSPDRLIDAA